MPQRISYVPYDTLNEPMQAELRRCAEHGTPRPESSAVRAMQYDDLLNFEASSAYTPEQKAALRYAQAIAWGPSSVDEDLMWQDMERYFTEEQMVELGCFIGLTFGQQSWIRLLGIDHHQYLAGSSGGMAPKFEDAQSLAESKSSSEYWAAR
jgi:hypothetical protein